MRLWFTALCLVLPLGAQEAQGIIVGTIRDAVTGAPAEGVAVDLHSINTAGSAVSKKQVTSSAGNFRFDELPNGYFELRFRKNGYVDSSFESGPVSHVHVNTGTNPESLTVDLIPTGTIEGKVLDEDGKPVKGVVLYAERPSKQSVMTVSEDAGHYRLHSLPPGEYWIRARVSYSLRKETSRRDTKTGQVTGLIPSMYVPGVDDRASATAVDVAAGGTIGGFDIRLKNVPLIAVSGQALDGKTREPFAGQVEIAPEAGRGDGARKPVGADGSFVFDLIPPGRYLLLFYRGTQPSDLAFATPIDTGSAGSSGVAVTVPAFVSIAGRFVFPPEKARAWGAMEAILNNGRQSRSARAAPDGRFAFDNVPPGPWKLSAQPASGVRQWYVESIQSGSRNVMAQGLMISEGANERVDIVIGADAAAIAGTAPAGLRVRLADAEGHVIAEQASQPDNKFWISGLRPGEYKIYAGNCESKALTVKLAPSITAAVNLDSCTP